MKWESVVDLIIRVGLPAANYIINQWAGGGEMTPEKWAEAYKLASQSALDRAKAMVSANGLNPEDPQVKAILDMVAKA